MRTLHLFYVFLFVYFIPLLTQAQLLDSPYEAERIFPFNYDSAPYLIESINPDSMQKPFYISVENSVPSSTISQMHFSNSDFKLIDAVNTNDGQRYLSSNTYLSDIDGDGKNEIIVPVVSEHLVEFYLINVGEHNADKITFLKIPFFRKNPNVNIQYLKASKNLLLIYVNTSFPKKHDYRRIYAIDLHNFKVKWKKPSIDYCDKLFIIPSDSNSFYYTAHAYDNGLIFSNNTIYRLVNTKKKGGNRKTNLLATKAIVDTFFGKSPSPVTDLNAEDYAIDSVSYLVKMDFDGHILNRIRIGGVFSFSPKLIQLSADSVCFLQIDRVNNLLKVILFLPKSNTFLPKKVMQSSNVLNYAVWDKHFIFFDKKNMYKYFCKNNTLQISKNTTKQILFPFDNNPDYYYSINNNDFNLYNKLLKKVASIPKPNNGFSLYYFKSLKAFAVRNTRTTYFYRLRKASLRERLNKTTFKWIIITLLFILVITLLLWIYTMRLSRRKIIKNYKLLQKSKTELENTTSRLIRAEKLAVLGTIASAVAHQLNSPLGAILNSAQRLHTTDNIEDNVNLIEKAAIRSKKIVERFLIASRPADDTEMKTNMNTALEEFWELFGHQFEVSGIQIEQEIEDAVFLKIKPSYFNEVLANILFNARDSIIEADEEEKIISISCKKKNEEAVIIIKDSGEGFSDLILRGGFEAFLTTKERGKGTGLGLWIVEKVIREAGGKIKIGNYEKGAFVRIELAVVGK